MGCAACPACAPVVGRPLSVSMWVRLVPPVVHPASSALLPLAARSLLSDARSCTSRIKVRQTKVRWSHVASTLLYSIQHAHPCGSRSSLSGLSVETETKRMQGSSWDVYIRLRSFSQRLCMARRSVLAWQKTARRHVGGSAVRKGEKLSDGATCPSRQINRLHVPVVRAPSVSLRAPPIGPKH